MTTRPGERDDWPQLGASALHGLAGDLVKMIGPTTEADPAALLFDFLAAFGCAVGPGPYFVADGAAHGARIFPVLVGDTAKARKGTARANIARVFEFADPVWASDCVMGGLASGEGLISAVADADDDEGRSRDRRLLVVEPEFARVLAAAGRDGSTLSPIIRQAWDDGNLRVMTRRQPLVARAAHISLIGHITDEELVRRLNETEAANGFANRMLFALVRRSKLLPSGGTLKEEETERLAHEVRVRLTQARAAGRMHRTPKGEEIWASVYCFLASDDAPGLVGAITARSEAQVLRLSMLYALLDGQANIDEQHIYAAHDAWQYCAESARRIFGRRIGDPVADRLLEALVAAGADGLDATQQHAVFSRHVARDKIEGARDILERRGLVRTKSIETGGRPRIVTYPVSGGGLSSPNSLPSQLARASGAGG